MYDVDTRRSALTLLNQGCSLSEVSRRTGVSRSALRSWRVRLPPLPRMSPEIDCPRCTPGQRDLAAPAAYAYLLGLYLGDGCISSHPKTGGYYLRIACSDAWPGLIEECRNAMTAVLPGRSTYLAQKQGCAMVTSYSKHWGFLFPQHGPGKKHNRLIALESWQQEIVNEHPWEFLRGLVHSDGCRVTNWTTKIVRGERKRYEYPRYFFANKSDDIRRIYTGALDKLGITWTHCTRGGKPFNISVARRADVALLDEHIGPKH
ncbi:hypothetical protein ADZ36_04350 [Streptomyces fradiae]|uniref:Helix-turn-helix domain-containing protein n=4 Tax=Streptomyces TaxID=1883 RepID=A0A3R7EZF3_9ACTN|nr:MULTISPECIES: helix-turn-helix domain-containing protein [Streptomyces]KNE83581.1 hypothetical protein ADZ36_04350 [Streptomyces fradiae]OFA53262.1 hypothetical protein BEN35_09670 [Streptomyces fradiae]PQM25205.1 helix-turn-helix domain-containing protein [Streptomyces xinghaiensis]RKM99257.1 helix-turn-helix domain-containing protein [Streptomyces xinghaiensis]RNC75839.1 helix-turn-helix domain-containing protein [Streptomyces xinghaiensis]